jgi:LCP family protein required for cell wall assembly
MALKTSRNRLPNQLNPLLNRQNPDSPNPLLPVRKVQAPPPAPIEPPAAPDASPPSVGRPIALTVGAYVVFVLLVAVLLSGRFYSWSRDRVLRQSPVATWEQEDAAILAAAPNQDAATDAAVAAEAVTPAARNDAQPAPPLVQPINILLLGTDARPDDVDPARTDTMMLLSLNPDTQTVGLLSLPRDLWVPIPGQDVTTKINLAYVIGEERNYPGGGAQLAIDTVSSFIGRPVDYYVRVNFQGFVEIVDLIGGIDLVVPEPIYDEEYPTSDYGVETFQLAAGPQHLDGEMALKYVRTRNMDDDYARAARQQQVVEAIAEKVLRAGMIPTLITKFPTLFYTMRSSIDTNMPMAKQIELAQYASNASIDNIRRFVIDNRYGEETYSEEGAWILFPNRDMILADLERFFDEDGTGGTGGAASDGIDPRWVRVEVLNGTGQPRIAARTRDYLQARGWQVTSIDDADRSDYNHTLIINYGAPPSLIERLGTELSVQATPTSLSLDRLTSVATSPVDVRIVVGRDMLPLFQ